MLERIGLRRNDLGINDGQQSADQCHALRAQLVTLMTC